MLHSDSPALFPNQGIKFLSETEHPLNEAEEETDEATTQTHSKRSADEILTMTEKNRLESYWVKYHKQLPSGFDTLYTADKCDTCEQKHREKRKEQ